MKLHRVLKQGSSFTHKKPKRFKAELNIIMATTSKINIFNKELRTETIRYCSRHHQG